MSVDLNEYSLFHSIFNLNYKIYNLCNTNHQFIFDETSLLMLNELNLLNTILESLDNINIRKGFYEQLQDSSHPIFGSPHHKLVSNILDIIKTHIDKITLFPDTDIYLLKSYYDNLIDEKFVLVSEDLVLTEVLKEKLDNNLISFNIFNLLEYLLDSTKISENEFFAKVSEILKISLVRPTINIERLSFNIDTICKFLIYEVDQRLHTKVQTEFKYLTIFRQLFDSSHNSAEANQLFFKLFSVFYIDLKYKISSKHVKEIINIFLIRHPYYSKHDFFAKWLVYCCSFIPVIINKFTHVSDMHSYFLNIYKSLVLTENLNNIESNNFLKNIINEINLLPEKHLTIIHDRIKSCFIPDSQESKLFESLYQNMSIQKKLKVDN